jgi:hypothetical protein
MGSASRDKAQPLHITTKVDVTPTGEADVDLALDDLY